MPAQIERDIVTLAKESELEHKNIDDLVRERDLLNTNLRRTQKAVVKFEASRTSHRGWAHPFRICTGTGLIPAHICTRTGLTPAHICTGTQVQVSSVRSAHLGLSDSARGATLP